MAVRTCDKIFSVRSYFINVCEETRRHSRRVYVLKIFLFLSAFIMMFVFSWFLFFSGSTSFAPIILNDDTDDIMTLTMSNPRLEGYTSSQQPYWLKAEKAFQNRTHFELVKLQNIIAEVPAGKQGSIFIKAKIASYDGTNGFLQFDEPFTIKTKDGLIAQFVNANVNLLEKNLRTDKPVNIRRPGLFMTANSLQIREGGQIMHFQNGVHLIFNR